MQITSYNNVALYKSASNKTDGDDKTAASTNSATSIITNKKDKDNSHKAASASAALSILQSNKSNNSAREIKKQFAKQKLDQLKQRIEILKKMYAGNPKQLAKVLASAVKELKDIVKSYGSAIDGTNANVNTNVPTTTYDANGAAVGSNNSDSAEIISETQDVDNVEISDDEYITNQDTTNQDIGNKGTSNSNVTTNSKQNSNNTNSASNDDDDKEFLKDVRKLMAKIKEAFQVAKNQHDFDTSYKDDDELKENEKSFNEYYKASQSLSYEVDNLEAKINNSGTIALSNSSFGLGGNLSLGVTGNVLSISA